MKFTSSQDSNNTSTKEQDIHLSKILGEKGLPKSDYYDCMIHIDGTRENLAKIFLMKKVHNLSPLAITFNHHHYTNLQKRNIKKALELFDMDHLMFTSRISVLNRFKQIFPEHFDMLLKRGEAALQIKMAIKYKIPLLISHPSILNQAASFKYSDLVLQLDSNFIEGQLDPFGLQQFVGTEFSLFDLNPYQIPNLETIDKANISLLNIESFGLLDKKEVAEFLDEYFIWDENQDVLEDDDSYWIGSPDDWDFDTLPPEDRKPTKYELLAENSTTNRPLFHGNVQYCTRCGMPETSEGLSFDELGICDPCQSSEQKMHINWVERRKSLERLLDKYTSKDGNYYDCMIPISGGKDSTFQLYILTHLFKRKVLASTYSHNWYSKTGRYNLMNSIRQFDVDHVMFTPRRKVIHKLARKSLNMIGDSCWHCHAGVGAFPLQAALKFDVYLLIWGESVAENDGRATYDEPIVFDRDYFTKISARFYAEEMMDDSISKLDINPYVLPTHEEIDEKNIKGVHLGDYMFWDDERQMEFVRDNFAWREDNVEGTYKGYKSVECIMAGVHDYSKFIKRGFGRGTDHSVQDVRAGLLTKEEGFELAKKHDTKRPRALDYYLKITGYTEEEFEQILEGLRDKTAQKLP